MMNRPWAEAIPELVIAAVTVIVAAGAGYATAGWAGLGVVAIAAAALAALVMRFLLPRGAPDAARQAQEKPTARPVSGYSHRRFVVRTGIEQRGFYDFELRPVLEHLLAARLAERHGINLYQDPAAARRLLCRRRGDAALWQWIDPDPQHRELRAAVSDRRGIPRHVLARLIDRLEKL
ncbi:MAG: hypothetical protein JO345_40115 [Streptosporangiaceae bacterium]|nr:hypothetical protein [Streptosporangiaceae bacterium]